MKGASQGSKQKSSNLIPKLKKKRQNYQKKCFSIPKY